MNFTLDLNTLLQGVVLIVVAAGLKGIFSINSKVTILCAKLGKMEVWQTGHEKIDDERQERMIETVGNIRDRINKMIGSKAD